MLVSNRLVLLVGLAAVFLIVTFYSVPSQRLSEANGRLHSWSAAHKDSAVDTHTHAHTPTQAQTLDDDDLREPAVDFNPFPLSVDPLALPSRSALFASSSSPSSSALTDAAAAASAASAASSTTIAAVVVTTQPPKVDFFPFGIPVTTSTTKPKPTAIFTEAGHEFQRPQAFVYPKTNLKAFKQYPPHNYLGTGEENAFAAYLCTRDSSLTDPYFAATLQLVWRMLWSESARSLKHPFVVFVAPFIKQEQRDMLQGAGALVRELDLLAWEPEVTVDSRRRDAFSKINLWAQKDFHRIAALDSDIFPIRNIDDIFDAAQPRICDLNKLSAEDAQNSQGICDYTFAAVPVTSMKGMKEVVNVGVMVLQPNEYMHQRLLRGYNHTEAYDNRLAEQGFMNWAFAVNGPFPVTFLPREYNGYFPTESESETLRVLHEKLWAFDGMTNWTKGIWSQSWSDMNYFFDSKEFAIERKHDAVIRVGERRGLAEASWSEDMDE